MPEVKASRATPDKSLSRSRCNLAPFGPKNLSRAENSVRPTCLRRMLREALYEGEL